MLVRGGLSQGGGEDRVTVVLGVGLLQSAQAAVLRARPQPLLVAAGHAGESHVVLSSEDDSLSVLHLLPLLVRLTRDPPTRFPPGP